MFDLLQKSRTESPITFGEPGGNTSFSETMATLARSTALLNPVTAGPYLTFEVGSNRDAYRDLFLTSERQQRLVDNVFSDTRAQEEVYDRWIATVRDQAGVELENPLRGGYRSDAMRAIRNEVRAGGMTSVEGMGGVPDRQLQIFNDRLAEVQAANPDKADTLTFRDVREEARGVAREAEGNAQRAGKVNVNPVVGFGAQFAGGMWAGRRDPIFVGSLFAGPTSAIGRATLTRIATSGLFQGLFNAGTSALEQPAVQAWRDEVGVRSGIMPAIENVGMAFLFGFIPGVAIRGIQEEAIRIARPAAQRMIEGRPQEGDAETVLRALPDADQQTGAAVRTGTEMLDADRVLTPPPARNVTPEQHDSMNAAALKHADDPIESPSPQAVAAVSAAQREPEFVSWFGGSRVVDDAGQPRPVFHGTDVRFEQFDKARLGDATGAPSAKAAFFFSEDLELAKSYAAGANIYESWAPMRAVNRATFGLYEKANEAIVGLFGLSAKREGQVATTFLKAENPLTVDMKGAEIREESFFNIIQRAKDSGHDSVNFKNAIDPGFVEGVGEKPANIWAVFEPEQIKIARFDKASELPDPEIQARIAEANPQTRAEAERIASEVIEEQGTKADTARTRLEIDTPPEPPAPRPDAPARAGRDPMEKIPWVRDDGTPTTISRKQLAEIGQRDAEFSMLVRSCK